MVTTFTPDYVPSLTYKSREWAEIFQTRQDDAIRRLYPVALGEVIDVIVNIIAEELELAVGSSEEYNRYQWMLQALKTKLAVPEAIILDTNIGRIYLRESFENLGGDESDFWDGVNAVREDLKADSESTKVLSIAQKAAFWKNKVWPSDHYYSRTMAARRRYWGDLTPWWIWLDSGNKDYTYAFPRSAATNFVYRAEGRANDVFEAAMEEMAVEAENIIYEAISEYMSDPAAFQPYDVLAEFWEQGRPYEIYITETGRVGTRLGR